MVKGVALRSLFRSLSSGSYRFSGNNNHILRTSHTRHRDCLAVRTLFNLSHSHVSSSADRLPTGTLFIVQYFDFYATCWNELLFWNGIESTSRTVILFSKRTYWRWNLSTNLHFSQQQGDSRSHIFPPSNRLDFLWETKMIMASFTMHDDIWLVI